MTTTSIDSLLPAAEYASQRDKIFPSQQSFLWFLRHHRATLAREGALVRLAGRNFIDPVRADTVIASIGKETARTVTGVQR